jgi:DNA-directed RNA polymerase subunit M/transcription elongation factor TFIIS
VGSLLSKAQTQAKKYAWLLALNISTGDDPEADERTDRAQEPAVPCKKCHAPAMLSNEGEDGIAGAYKEYTCTKCGNVFRMKA